MRPDFNTFRWLGAEAPHLDAPHVDHCGPVAFGAYGGSTAAGARKNEDAALVWHHPDEGWVFSSVMDAHTSSESCAVVLDMLEEAQADIVACLARPVREAFADLGQLLLKRLTAPEARQRRQRVRGETAVLCCAQKAGFLWWWSIGDCLVHVIHPELMRLGQHAVNQRQFFEWVGEVDTFDLEVPAYSSGVRALRAGVNHILLTTDGLLEFGSRPFEGGTALAEVVMMAGDSERAVVRLLERVHRDVGRDSATLICWSTDHRGVVQYPANYPEALKLRGQTEPSRLSATRQQRDHPRP